MNILQRFRNWLEWRRRDREETVVATADFTTSYVRDGKKTGIESTHIVSFLSDGNGIRYTRVDSGDKSGANSHSKVVSAKVNWRVHGELPDHARRVKRSGGQKLTVIDGGAA